MQRGNNSKSKVIVVCFIVLVVIILGFFIVREYLKNPICVSRTVSGENEQTVQLNVEVNMFKKPNSFIIEERLGNETTFVSSEPKELFYENGKISWSFWRGGLKVANTKINYQVNNPNNQDIIGRLVLAVNKDKPDEGYQDVIIGPGRVCI